MSVASWCSKCFCVVLCVGFLYRPFCHGVLKLDISTLFTTFCLWTSLQFILSVKICYDKLLTGTWYNVKMRDQILYLIFGGVLFSLLVFLSSRLFQCIYLFFTFSFNCLRFPYTTCLGEGFVWNQNNKWVLYRYVVEWKYVFIKSRKHSWVS